MSSTANANNSVTQPLLQPEYASDANTKESSTETSSFLTAPFFAASASTLSSSSTSSATSINTDIKISVSTQLKKYYTVFNHDDGNFYLTDQPRLPEGINCTILELGAVPQSDFLDQMVRHKTAIKTSAKMSKNEMSKIGTAITYVAMIPQGLFAALMGDIFVQGKITENEIARGAIGFIIFLTGVWGKARIVNFFNDSSFKNFWQTLEGLLNDAKNPDAWTLRGSLWRLAVTGETLVFMLLFASLTKGSFGEAFGIAKLLRKGFSWDAGANVAANFWTSLPFVLCSALCNALGTRNILFYGGLTFKELYYLFFPENTPKNGDKYYYMWMKFHLTEIVNSNDQDWPQQFRATLAQVLKDGQITLDLEAKELRLPSNISADSFDIAKIRRLFERLNANGEESQHFDKIVDIDKSRKRRYCQAFSLALLTTFATYGFINFYDFGAKSPTLLSESFDPDAGLCNQILKWTLGILSVTGMNLMAISSVRDIAYKLADLVAVPKEDRRYLAQPQLLTKCQDNTNAFLAHAVTLTGGLANGYQQYTVDPSAIPVAAAIGAPYIQEITPFRNISEKNDLLKAGDDKLLVKASVDALVFAADTAGDTISDLKANNHAATNAEEKEALVVGPKNTSQSTSYPSSSGFFSSSALSSSSSSSSCSEQVSKQTSEHVRLLGDEDSKHHDRGCPKMCTML